MGKLPWGNFAGTVPAADKVLEVEVWPPTPSGTAAEANTDAFTKSRREMCLAMKREWHR